MKLLILYIAAISNLLAAQSSDLTLRILYLDAPADAPSELYLFDGKETQKVKLPKMNLSPVYTLRADAKAIALLNSEPESIEAIPRGAPRVKIPEGVKDFYIFISPDPDNPVVPVRMNLADAGTEDFEVGQMLWLNLSDKTIGGKVGSEEIVVQPKSKHVMDAPVNEAVRYPVKLAFKMSDSNQLYPLCQTKWNHNPNSRNIAFVFSRPNMRTPRVMVFPDYRLTWRKSEKDAKNEG